MKNRVGQRFVQRHTQQHESTRFAQLDAGQRVLQVADQRRNQGAVVVQDEIGFVAHQAVHNAAAVAVALGRRQDLFERFGQVAGQALLGHVAGGPLLQCLDGDVLAAVSRHQNDWHAREFDTNGLHQLQAVHLGHQ